VKRFDDPGIKELGRWMINPRTGEGNYFENLSKILQTYTQGRMLRKLEKLQVQSVGEADCEYKAIYPRKKFSMNLTTLTSKFSAIN
jgi:hypothetical protein